jgi:hypothetical protein
LQPIVVHRLRLLEPPQVRPLERKPEAVQKPDTRTESRGRPVSLQASPSDVEANVAPTLQSNVTVIDPKVVQAAYQQAPGGFAAPPGGVMGAPPQMPPMTGSAPIMPGPSSPNIVPGPGSGNAIPGNIPLMPGASPSNLPYPNAAPNYNYNAQPPRYAPTPNSTMMSGEPFVTAPPCQFDAGYMVEPASCNTPVASSGCGPMAGPSYPYAPYSGIPANIAPPTMMPNQVPYGLYSNSGWRPLIGLGQDSAEASLVSQLRTLSANPCETSCDTSFPNAPFVT